MSAVAVPEPVLLDALNLSAKFNGAPLLVVLDEHNQWLTPLDTWQHRREFAGRIVSTVGGAS